MKPAPALSYTLNTSFRYHVVAIRCTIEASVFVAADKAKVATFEAVALAQRAIYAAECLWHIRAGFRRWEQDVQLGRPLRGAS